jgi:predicted dehydrogenase
MAEKAARQDASGMDRRTFLASAAAVGAGVVLGARPAFGAAAGGADDLNVALIGAGAEGMVLLREMLKVPGIRVRAVCDIWDYSQRYASGVVRAATHELPAVYVDYRDMLAKEKDLDVAIVATPDWVHAEHTVACLDAGLHVYCEKEMSNTLEGARQIVEAARRTGRKVQIGHQRRSNPYYIHALKLINEDKALGRITNCYGQWNRPAQPLAQVPEKLQIPQDVLDKYGYGTMDRFRNWRWYRTFSGGPIADLGSHQIDVFNWFLGTPPANVIASGGLDYYHDGRQWYDSIMAVYEYPTAAGTVRAFYQVLNTTSYGGYYETFMGDRGTINISEDPSKGFYVPEPTVQAPEWVDLAHRVDQMGASAIQLIGETRELRQEKKEGLGPSTQKPNYQLHLENFFDAVRKGTPLSCPAELAYETTVSVLRVNDAVESNSRLGFKAEEFRT